MSAPFLIIDGYNLLHAAGLARMRYGPGDLERARHRLLMLLIRRLDPEELRRCTVVFDAQSAPQGVPRKSQLYDLQIVFAPPATDADSVIEDLLAKHSAPRQVVVVSSDHRLQKAARRRDGQAMDSDAFYDVLIARPERPLSPSESPSPDRSDRPASPDETAYWLREFGAEPEHDERLAHLPEELQRLQQSLDEGRDLEGLP